VVTDSNIRELITLHQSIAAKKTGWLFAHSLSVRPLFNITVDEKTVNLSLYFDTFKEENVWWWLKTSRTMKPKPWISDYIRKRGWQMIAEESLLIARRKVKEYYYPPMPLS